MMLAFIAMLAYMPRLLQAYADDDCMAAQRQYCFVPGAYGVRVAMCTLRYRLGVTPLGRAGGHTIYGDDRDGHGISARLRELAVPYCQREA